MKPWPNTRSSHSHIGRPGYAPSGERGRGGAAPGSRDPAPAAPKIVEWRVKCTAEEHAMSQNVSNTILKLNSGADIPQVGLGVWQAGGGTVRAVAEALQQGYRHVDTARVYGNEHQVGQAIRDSGIPRSEVFV